MESGVIVALIAAVPASITALAMWRRTANGTGPSTRDTVAAIHLLQQQMNDRQERMERGQKRDRAAIRRIAGTLATHLQETAHRQHRKGKR